MLEMLGKKKYRKPFEATGRLYEEVILGNVEQNFTVPAFNLRALTFDASRALFRAAKKLEASAFIIELARSEMEYTAQPPKEYADNVLRAAKKENWKGPIFLQADHFSLTDIFKKEVKDLEKVILDSIKAGFYNIDIDCSALGNEKNIDETLHFIEFIRKNEPKEIEISIGAEVDKIGGCDTTQEDLEEFLTKLKREAESRGLKSIIKIACQLGTTHGGKVLPNGELENVEIDFEKLKQFSQVAKTYLLAGIVQHGASTLKDEYFKEFPKAGVLEIHLSTEFQNIILDSQYFPADLKDKMYKWLLENFKKERQRFLTDEQFFYKIRKRGLGPFERQILSIPQKAKDKICEELENKFTFFLENLGVAGSVDMINKIYF